MGEGILDINGDTAVCSCGGRVERAMGGVPVYELGKNSRRIMLAYKYKCTGCVALGFQGLLSFMADNLVRELSG